MRLTPEQQVGSCSEFQHQLDRDLRRAFLDLDKVKVAHTATIEKQEALVKKAIQELVAERQALETRLHQHQRAWKQSWRGLVTQQADRLPQLKNCQ